MEPDNPDELETGIKLDSTLKNKNFESRISIDCSDQILKTEIQIPNLDL